MDDEGVYIFAGVIHESFVPAEISHFAVSIEKMD